MITLRSVQKAANTAAMTRFVGGLLARGEGWRLVDVQRQLVRLEPPAAYWASYRVRIERLPADDGVAAATSEDIPADAECGASEGDDHLSAPAVSDAEPGLAPAANSDGPVAGIADAMAAEGEQATEEAPAARVRELRLVARAAFDGEIWARYRERLQMRYKGSACNPIDGLGFPVIDDENQQALWFYPIDPSLPGLTAAADAAAMATLLRDSTRSVLREPGEVRRVKVTSVRYIPEISAILRYDIEADPHSASRAIFGKVQHVRRAERASAVLELIWGASRVSEWPIQVPEPLGYYPELGLFLQSRLDGEAVKSDRTSPTFLRLPWVAAKALAAVHGLEAHLPGSVLTLETELHRLDNVVDQFRLVHPRGAAALHDLLARIRAKAEHTSEEAWVSTHGDFKYDQFLYSDRTYSIIDFDYFAWSETSYDLGKFCAHLVPSFPTSWQQSYRAEEARRLFLGAYREQRPDATLQRFAIYEATHLANRSMTLMWSQLHGWEGAADTMLAMGLERLGGPACC